MKFPYGISDFEKIATKGYFYIDRTDRIPMLEDRGDYLLFIRPRRFGKSLLLSILRHYYDIGQAERFETLFGHLAIGANPTPSRNRYMVLQWDFSCVEPWGSTEDIRRSLHGHVNGCIYGFYLRYESILNREPTIDSEDALSSLQYIMDSEREVGRGRADLTMIIRPDMRKYEIFDVLIEFKYLTLKEAGMSGEQAKEPTPEALRELPGMAKKMAEARDQAIRYGDELEKKYGNLRLRRYAVVSLGFERIWWEEVEGTIPRRREPWEKKEAGIEGDNRL